MPAASPSAFRSFRDFYPFYLTEHSNRTSRRLHVAGTGAALVLAVGAVLIDWRLAFAAVLAGYGFAWLGHFRFERNRPATFRHPLWSLMGDFRLFFETVAGRRPW